MATVLIDRGNNKGQRVIIAHFPFTIGREADCSLVINDLETSRYHCRIKCRGDLFIIEDLGSRNGTYINGERIVNSTIANGDKILVGNTEIQFLAPHPRITIREDTDHLDMNNSEKSPIIINDVDTDPSQARGTASAQRFKITQYIDNEILTDREHLLLSESIQDLVVMETTTECAKVLLKTVARLLVGVENTAFFSWKEATRSLLPKSHWKREENSSFTINSGHLKDAITRKQGLTLPSSEASGPTVVFPMIYHNVILGVLLVEKSLHQEASPVDLGIVSNLVSRAAPLFETLFLRNEMDSWLIGMVETIIALVEAKDTYTRGHSERVCRYASAIADQMALGRETKRMLMVSALCHDIGKVGIPDHILKKASILSAEEYEEMKLHPLLGAEIIKHLPHYNKFISGIKYHHEKWDGTGYPDGLLGEEIPFFGRIIAIADVFDAMVSGRAYSGFIDQNEAIEKLRKEADLFDPEILKAFFLAFETGRLTIKTTTQPGSVSENNLIIHKKK